MSALPSGVREIPLTDEPFWATRQDPGLNSGGYDRIIEFNFMKIETGIDERGRIYRILPLMIPWFSITASQTPGLVSTFFAFFIAVTTIGFAQ